MFVRDKLVIFDEDIGPGDRFWSELIEIFRGGVERDIFFLVFDSWNYFLSHSGFSAWKVLTVFGVNVVVGGVGFSF